MDRLDLVVYSFVPRDAGQPYLLFALLLVTVLCISVLQTAFLAAVFDRDRELGYGSKLLLVAACVAVDWMAVRLVMGAL